MLMHVCELKLSEANQFWGLNTTIIIAERAIVGAYGKRVEARLISGRTQLPVGTALEFETLVRWQPWLHFESSDDDAASYDWLRATGEITDLR